MSSSLGLRNSAGAIVEISGEDLVYGVGKAIQVSNKIVTTQSSQTILTTDTVVGDLTLDIIAKGINSRFIIEVRWFGETDDAWNVCFNIQFDGVRVNIPNTRGYGLTLPIASYTAVSHNSSTPDTSNFKTSLVTSSVVGSTYTFRLVADAADLYTLWNNRCFLAPASGNEAGSSEITITEIGGV